MFRNLSRPPVVLLTKSRTMYCPNCAVPVTDDQMQFCTTCGHGLSERPSIRKAFRQAFLLFAVGLMLIPVWMFIGPAFPPADRFVESHPSTTWLEQIAWIAMWMSFIAAGMRLVFALVFEKGAATDNPPNEEQAALRPRSPNAQLSSADSFQGVSPERWRTTRDLAEPLKVKPRKSGGL